MRCCFSAAQTKGSCLTSKPLFWIVEKERPNLPPARSPSKVFSAIADGNVVGVDIAIDTEIEVGEVEGLVEVIAGERLFRVVGRLVDDEVGGAGVKYDESLFFWGGKPTWIVPDQDKSWSREGLLEVRLCLLA